MTDVLFYHLTQRTLDGVLPELLERTLARSWRAVIKVGEEERLADLDRHLWTYADDSFLPHGTAELGDSENQPIYLTADDARPNGAEVLFLVMGAEPGIADGYERWVDLFDGTDPDAVAAARTRYKAAKDAGHTVTYWAENDQGKFEQKG